MSFPRYVFKRGTGKQATWGGPFEAEGRIVSSEAELEALGQDWCASPQEAATPLPEKQEAKHEVKPAKKAK